VQQFRDALERSVTLSRDRIQEVADDAVKRGRMTRGDANKLVSDLVSRGRKQSDRMLRDMEKMLRQARSEAERRAKQARREAERRGKRARREAERRAKPARRRAEATAGRAARAARDAADQPLAQADRLRRRAGVGPTFPITAYDQLTAPQVKTRLTDLRKGELRKVRDYERRNQNRKSVVAAIDKKLG
jgi:polyhydroxyalkanoate synthesis regulator phasin